VITYALRHLQVLLYSLGQLWRSGLSSLMTVAVIGITLALPSGLYVLLDNARQVAAGWEGGAQISLFLTPATSEQDAQALAGQLRRTPGVAAVDYVSRAAALEEFKRLSGFGDALDALDGNPLPAVLIVHPAASHNAPAALEDLVERLGAVEAVDIAQLDLEWVKRLHAILLLAQRGVVLLACLLAVAVLVIIGNTIRLAILNRKDEIEVIKLIGGTDAFIRRPYLYSGLLQGLLGGMGAWLLVSLGLVVLADPTRRLAALYASSFQVQGLGPNATLALLVSGGLLGWMASWIAVGRHLSRIEPT
jgi:cell division transport system permease protein